MGRHSKTVIEYRSYEFPPHFPLRVIAGDEWRISDVPSGVLHFHNCLEIGICESDSGKMNFSGKVVPFKAGDITFVAGDVPHTTWSDPGCASKWSYIFTDAEELLRPFFDPAALPNSRLLAQVLHGWSGIFSSADHPALANYVKMILQEMQTRSLNYEISVRGLFVALITEVMRLSTEQNDSASANRMVIAPALTYIILYGEFQHPRPCRCVQHERIPFSQGVPGACRHGAAGLPEPDAHCKSLQPFAHDR